MKRLNKENINTPEFFNKKFNGELAYCDMERQELLAKYFNGGVYVDVGCMDSPMPSILAEKYDNIYALDFADDIIKILSSKYPKVNYRTIPNEYTLPFKDGEVDYLVAGEFIEHLENPQLFFDEAKRVVKKGGWIAISTPWEEGVSQGLIGGKQHIWSYTKDDMDNFLTKPEIQLLKETGGISMIVWKQL